MGYLLGIDVGTTRTAAAIGRAEAGLGDFEIVNLGDRSSSVPSVLYIGADGNVLVGDAAERRATSDPDRVVREFKRRIGDPTPIVVGGRPWLPEDLSARLVRWVVDRVAEREGGPADRIAITHPASWGAHKKDRFAAALTAYGIPASFLAEPEAAALHYAAAERVESGSTIAVYDLGGGTFDAAVVHKDGRRFTLTGRPEGVERLGGIDFDEVVFEHVRAGLPQAFDSLDESDPAVLSAVAAVRRECTEAKEALSSDTEVSLPVLTPAAQGSVRLHRSEFETMIRSRIEETVDALRRAVESANLTPDQLSAVLLVGGSSRIPLVAELVSEQLGRPVAVDADPKNAIAKGAALSLHPAGVSASGGMSARLPAQREPRHAAETGAIPWYAAPNAPGSAAGRPAPPPPGAPFPTAGPPLQRVAGSAHPPPPLMPPPYPSRPQATTGPPTAARGQQPPGRSPAMLVSIGGLSAAVAVIATLFVLPSAPSTAVPTPVADVPSTTFTPPPTTTSIEPTTTVEPPPPPVVPPPKRTTRRPPPPPPPTTTTTPPPQTTETTTTETTTTTTTTESSPSPTTSPTTEEGR
jgi:cell division ATPase FtsA